MLTKGNALLKTVVVITGASSGVGKDAAIELSKNENYHIVLVARNAEKLNETKQEIENHNGNAYNFATDISIESGVKDLAEYIEKTFGKLNVLINNAGMGIFKPIVDLELDEWNLMHDTMVVGTFLCCKYLIPLILKSNHEEKRQIIINSSFWGQYGRTPLCASYIAAKFAQRGFSLSLREELRHQNIKVICLMPGSIDTPFFSEGGWVHDPNRILNSKEIAKMLNDLVKYNSNFVIEEIVVQAINPD